MWNVHAVRVRRGRLRFGPPLHVVGLFGDELDSASVELFRVVSSAPVLGARIHVGGCCRAFVSLSFAFRFVIRLLLSVDLTCWWVHMLMMSSLAKLGFLLTTLVQSLMGV